MELSELDTKRQFAGHIVTNARLTSTSSADEVRELIIDVEMPGLSLDVGQSIGVLAPGRKDTGQEYHLRLYSVADFPEVGANGAPRIKIAVKRCHYIDDYSGERYDGVASNYLCDLRPGDGLTLAGPFGLPFEMPEEEDANLILIATSTGIAPFRAFVRRLFERHDFKGKIWLFYGAKSGLDMAYLNDERDDFAQYYDRETFEAFRALSPRPHFGDPIAWGDTMASRGKELWRLLSDAKTYTYVAGLKSTSEALDAALVEVAGSKKAWERRKAELSAGGRWVELLY